MTSVEPTVEPTVDTIGESVVQPAVEPIIVVLGMWCGGTSAVAGVLHRLGVFMASEFDWAGREPHDIWEDLRLAHICRDAFDFTDPCGQLRTDPVVFERKLRRWADEHRASARAAGARPGVKNPHLSIVVDSLRTAWGPIVPVVVDRPVGKVVASLTRCGWWKDEDERTEVTKHTFAARDRALGDAPMIRVDFEELRAEPVAAIARLVGELGLTVTQAQLDAAADMILRPDDPLCFVASRASEQEHARDVLRAKVEADPDDGQLSFFLAENYFTAGDLVNAHQCYARAITTCRWDEEVYFGMYRIAESLAGLGASWSDTQDAYLRAWEFRPTRAEAVYMIARRYREAQRYWLSYVFAKLAAEIPFPEDDFLSFGQDIYAWRAADEQATSAALIGRLAEAFTLWRRVLARPDIPDDDRRRIAINRDACAPAMITAASTYPEAVVRSLLAGPRDSEVTVTLVAGPDRESTEATLNSFLTCFLDVSRAGRVLLVDAGLPADDRAALTQRYGFVEFTHPGPTDEPAAVLAHLRAQIHGRYWLHVGQGWRFFAPENLITRLTAVLDDEPHVVQVGINFGDAATLTNANAAEATVRRSPAAGRYVLTDAVARGPAMFDALRLDSAGGIDGLATRAAAGLRTASLDEVLCVGAG